MLRIEYALSAALLALAGCSSSSSSDGIIPDIDAVLADDAGTVAEAYTAGKTLSSGYRLSSAVLRDYDAEETSKAEAGNPKFTITKTGDKSATVTLGDDGDTFEFEEADIMPEDDYTWYKDLGDGQEIWLWTRSADGLENALNGNSQYAYHQIWGYSWDQPIGTTDSNLTGYAVVGTETTASALEGKASATYSGYAEMDVWDKGSTNRDDISRVYGDLTMQADFGEGKISGTVTDMHRREREEIDGGDWDWTDPEKMDDDIVMAETDIDGNGFEGDMKMGSNGDKFGYYSGKFFGKNGEEVGGVLGADFDGGEDNIVGTGFFTGEQDD